ncbi:MAG: class I SAM-dependent methyltransferase [Bacteroidia bacterium]|nr:class I SAM-dependent methyltransferase [Bacteroidia bacterium]
MEHFDRKKHWENIYQTKALNEVSWYQPNPSTSIGLIEQAEINKHAKIIDIGGGDSFLVDKLLEKGYTNITVLDISEAAITRAKKRLGNDAEKVKWIVNDVSKFDPIEKYDVWHDRAAFHFLTSAKDIDQYVQTVNKGIIKGGKLIIGTFSESGPKKCSGIEIKQYSENTLSQLMSNGFKKEECFSVDHTTPSGNTQNFLFCKFIKE